MFVFVVRELCGCASCCASCCVDVYDEVGVRRCLDNRSLFAPWCPVVNGGL